MSELQQVVADLQRLAEPFAPGSSHNGMMEARRALKVLRELAKDFDKYAFHPLECTGWQPGYADWEPPCSCGHDAAREKWRLS